jgi:hypothetical protein|tara:strand:- start:151 stop:447 length:297 start_codon:yes stop_codon:yes gene_type:complete
VEQKLTVNQPSEWFWTEVDELNPDALRFAGFCSSIVGYASQYTKQYTKPPVLVYDYDKMVETLMFRDHMNYQDAVEYLHNNTLYALVGENAPMVLRAV